MGSLQGKKHLAKLASRSGLRMKGQNNCQHLRFFRLATRTIFHHRITAHTCSLCWMLMHQVWLRGLVRHGRNAADRWQRWVWDRWERVSGAAASHPRGEGGVVHRQTVQWSVLQQVGGRDWVGGAWWAGLRGRVLVGEAWLAGLDGRGLVGGDWWAGLGGQSLLSRAWWRGLLY